MNTSQIKYVLQQNGYSITENTELDLTKFSIIFLDQDGNLYPNAKQFRYKFDYTNGYLKVYEGKVRSNTFIPNLTDRPNHIISFDLIAGFLQGSTVDDIGQILYHKDVDFDRTPIENSFTIKFYNYNNTLLDTQYVLNGSTLSYKKATPVKPEDEDYTYTFTGWLPALGTATKNDSYVAQFTAVPKTYTIKFVDTNNNILQESQVAQGVVPVYSGTTPSKTDTEYSYFNFTGWRPTLDNYNTIYTNALPAATANTTYYAVIDEYERMDWIQANKQHNSLINIGNISGNIAVEFDGILGENYGGGAADGISDSIVIGDAHICSLGVNNANGVSRRINNGWVTLANSSTYNPGTRHVWRLERNTNNVKFIIDGNICENVTETVAGDSLPCYIAGQYRPANSKIYFAKAYSNNTLVRDLVPVQCVRTELYGMFDIIVSNHKPYMESGSQFNGSRFKVQFLNYNGTVLQSTLYRYKATPSYTGSAPTKSADENYTYAFTNWDKSITSVTESTTYVAQFVSMIKYKLTKAASSYEITLTYPDNSTAKVTQVNDGTTVKYLGNNNEFITTSIGNTSHTLKSIYPVVYNNVSYAAGSVITTIKYYEALNINLTANITN